MNGDHGRRPLSLSWWHGLWARTDLPIKVGIVVGCLGALLAAAGLGRGASEPFSWRGLAMAILLAGGSWGMVSWALTTAVVEARTDEQKSAREE